MFKVMAQNPFNVYEFSKMRNYSSWTGAAPIAFLNRKTEGLKESWQFRWKPVCGSTEAELSRWLNSQRTSQNNPKAFFASRQTHGKGQRGRVWHSPLGGVWLSAAIPCKNLNQSAGLFGLGVAVALATRLEESDIPVRIKWPNDLLVSGKKVAGFLPRISYRGHTPSLMRIGIGLNVCNPVPNEGVSLSEFFGLQRTSILRWSLEVLIAIEKASILLKKPEDLCMEGERLLWEKQVKKINSDEIWSIKGLDLSGQLRVFNGIREETWNRWS